MVRTVSHCSTLCHPHATLEGPDDVHLIPEYYD